MKEDLINLKNQAIAQITEAKDLEELERIRIGRLLLGDLKQGEYREMTAEEMKMMAN